MTETDFVSRFGFLPNAHELRVANGRDPLNESLRYDELKYGSTIPQNEFAWKIRGQALAVAFPDGRHLRQADYHPPSTVATTPADVSATDVSCSRRSSQVVRVGACDLCSLRGQPFDVFACDLHKECSLGRKHSKVRSCVACQDRLEREPPTKTLTIGMATFDDVARVRWTINALRETHAKELADAGYTWEIVVIDNNPVAGEAYSNHSRHLRIFNESSDPPVRVLDFGEQQGTFPPKAKVFDVARGEWVIVIDCHCLIPAGAIKQTLDWLTAHRDFDGLLHGVLVGDSGQRLYTHQEREYRDNMLAMWQSYDHPDENLPTTSGETIDGVTDVPQHGAFLFGCRRDAWPTDKLPTRLRGFGGDENLDALFRSLGRRVVTFDWLHCWHDFLRLDQLYGYEKKSSTSLADRLRNDLLWFIASGETHRIVEALEHYQVSEAEKVGILTDIGLWKPESVTHEDRSHLPNVRTREADPERRGQFRFANRLARPRDAAVRAG